MIDQITSVMQLSGAITPVKTIGERLHAERVLRGLTQAALAARAGLRQSAISNLERGVRGRPREIVALAQALGLHPAWLERGEEPKYSHDPDDGGERDKAAQLVDAILGMSPLRWAGVRTLLDMLAARPEMRDDVLAELRALLGAPSAKRRASGEQ